MSFGKTTFLRRLPIWLLLALLLTGGGWLAWKHYGERTLPDASAPVPHNAETGDAAARRADLSSADKKDAADKHGAAENGVDLALKSILLSQGEGGFELWRLKAEWANIQKTDERVIVEQPRLTYFMRDGGSPLQVESVSGIIEQKTETLQFIDAVRVNQDEKLITSDRLVYDGKEKTMSFPSGGDFFDAGVSGTAGHLVWRLMDKRIEASGGVAIHFGGQNTPPVQAGPDPGS